MPRARSARRGRSLRTEVTIELRQSCTGSSARSAAIMVHRRAAAARSTRRSTDCERISARWPGADRWALRAAGPPAMRWWGWGDPDHTARLPAHRRWSSCARRSESPARRVRRSRSGRAAAERRAERERAGERLRAIVGAEGGARAIMPNGSMHAAGKGYRRSGALRAGRRRGRPTRSCCPRATSRCAAVLELCARQRAGGGAVRRRHERGRGRRAVAGRACRGDRAGHAPDGADRWSSTASRGS